MDSHRFIEDFLKPYIAKSYPNADIVFLAGSFGRAMKNGDYAPQKSSDADLVIVYTDFAKDGHKTSFKSYKTEDVAPYLGEDQPRLMMIDCNVHDLTTLIYHNDVVRTHLPFAFIPVMIDEGYVVFDKTGIAPVLQRQAKEFLDAGPLPPEKAACQSMMAVMHRYMADIRDAPTVEEKRMLGVLCMVEACETLLILNRYWSSGANQAYRSFERRFPDEARAIVDAFSPLIRDGESHQAEIYLQDILRRGYAFTQTLPESKTPLVHATENVPADIRAGMNRMFCKFMAEHLGTSCEKSSKRGELAFLENLSATVGFVKRYAEEESGAPCRHGQEALRWLNIHAPDVMPAALAALDDNDYTTIEKVTHQALAKVGGLQYSELMNYYIEDVARVMAIAGTAEEKSKVAAKIKPDYKL